MKCIGNRIRINTFINFDRYTQNAEAFLCLTAIWMLPEDWVYGGWPRSGEIDIIEAIGAYSNTHNQRSACLCMSVAVEFVQKLTADGWRMNYKHDLIFHNPCWPTIATVYITRHVALFVFSAFHTQETEISSQPAEKKLVSRKWVQRCIGGLVGMRIDFGSQVCPSKITSLVVNGAKLL